MIIILSHIWCFSVVDVLTLTLFSISFFRISKDDHVLFSFYIFMIILFFYNQIFLFFLTHVFLKLIFYYQFFEYFICKSTMKLFSICYNASLLIKYEQKNLTINGFLLIHLIQYNSYSSNFLIIFFSLFLFHLLHKY